MKPKNLCLVAAVVALSLATGLLTSSGTAHAALPTVPHYDCYNITPAVAPTLPTSLTLQTQFGTEVVQVVPPVEPVYTKLCLPALKKVGTNWEGDLEAPHVECVPIIGKPVNRYVSLETQFGLQAKAVVGSPKEACMPATKAIYPDSPSTSVPTAPHYECYSIYGASPPGLPPTVLVKDQFLTAAEGTMVDVGAPTRLCLAAKKNGVGSLSVPDVECFAMTGPTAGIYVNLLTQFLPVQEHVLVKIPRELCVPVLKTVLTTGTGVGGAQELPEVAGNADSGDSSLPYAAIAGAAAGLIILGAGGWYARRRWLS
jgi:hypothetical protein